MQKRIFIGGENLKSFIEMPDDYKVGTKIACNVFWYPQCHHAGKVVFDLDYSFATKGLIFSGVGEHTALGGTDETAKKYMATPMPNLPAFSKENTMLELELKRDKENVNDTYGGEITILGLSLLYDQI